jgi:hypothetical protein
MESRQVRDKTKIAFRDIIKRRPSIISNRAMIDTAPLDVQGREAAFPLTRKKKTPPPTLPSSSFQETTTNPYSSSSPREQSFDRYNENLQHDGLYFTQQSQQLLSQSASSALTGTKLSPSTTSQFPLQHPIDMLHPNYDAFQPIDDIAFARLPTAADRNVSNQPNYPYDESHFSRITSNAIRSTFYPHATSTRDAKSSSSQHKSASDEETTPKKRAAK